jgi:hypothetical protein
MMRAMGDSGLLPKMTGADVAAAVRLCPEPSAVGPSVVRVSLETERLGRVTVSLARMREARWKRLFWSPFRADPVSTRPPET